jgi:hypothetical protein
VQQAAVGQAAHRVAQDRQDAAEAPLEPGPADFGEAIRLRDHQPPQAQHVGLKEATQESVGEAAQRFAHVLCVVQAAADRLRQPVDHLHGLVEDDVGEQALLVGEVLVEGLLGHRSPRGDLVRGGAEVAVPQEHLGRRLDDRLPPALGSVGVRGGTRLSHEPS